MKSNPTFIEENGTQSVLFHPFLSVDAKGHGRLEGDFITKHKKLKDKPNVLFCSANLNACNV
jgi:hypothetical protein